LKIFLHSNENLLLLVVVVVVIYFSYPTATRIDKEFYDTTATKRVVATSRMEGEPNGLSKSLDDLIKDQQTSTQRGRRRQGRGGNGNKKITLREGWWKGRGGVTKQHGRESRAREHSGRSGNKVRLLF